MELASKSIQSNFLTCFLCSKLYEEPTTLQCLHSFCKKCILKNIQQQTSDVTKKCPVCQETIDENLEEKNTNMLLKNRVVFLKNRPRIYQILFVLYVDSNFRKVQWQLHNALVVWIICVTYVQIFTI